MSTAVVVPPNSSSLLRHVPRLTARARNLLTVTNLHFAGIAALTVVVLYLVAHLIYISQALSARDADALSQQRSTLVAAELAAMPLRGLDVKLTESTTDANEFYEDRLPYAWSAVLTELGALTKRENVRLTRVQYSPAPVLTGNAALTEIRMDANISGDYRPIVQFINAVERDPMFFVIGGINFTGQQSGQVNLRIRLTTYLRAPLEDEVNSDLPAATTPAEATATGVAP